MEQTAGSARKLALLVTLASGVAVFCAAALAVVRGPWGSVFAIACFALALNALRKDDRTIRAWRNLSAALSVTGVVSAFASRPRFLDAVLYLALALGLFLRARHPTNGRRRVVGTLALAVAGVALPTLIDHLDDAPLDPATLLSLALFSLAVGLLCLLRNDWPTNEIVVDAPGGEMARRLLFPTLVAPVAAAWIGIFIVEHGWLDARTTIAIFAPVLPILFAVLIWLNARTLNEKHRLERALTTSLDEKTHLLNLVIETTPNGLLVVDRKGKYTLVNPAAREILGTEQWDVADDHHAKRIGLFREDRVTQFPSAELPLFRGLRGERSDGILVYVKNERVPEGRWVVSFGRPLREERTGEITGGMSVFIDVTAYRKLEEARERTAAELARSNEDLARFAYVASHDLQEPLRSIATSVGLLDRKYGDQLDGTAKELTTFAVDAARRMRKLIDELLEYSRLGSAPKERERVSMERTFDNAMQNLRAAKEEAGAEVVREPLPDVIGDASQFERLFQNLIGNAIKYRAGTPKIHVGAEEANGSLHFFVRDNGLGFDSAHAKKIFEVFTRVHTGSGVPGTGVGLAVCKRIVERHGGKIWAESAPGQGSVFHFTLPPPPG